MFPSLAWIVGWKVGVSAGPREGGSEVPMQALNGVLMVAWSVTLKQAWSGRAGESGGGGEAFPGDCLAQNLGCYGNEQECSDQRKPWAPPKGNRYQTSPACVREEINKVVLDAVTICVGCTVTSCILYMYHRQG